jgi:sugar phosphate isomerase/epimerase
MKYVYFTKSLQLIAAGGLATFCKAVGFDGVDLAVRPGFLINPDNVRFELPKWVKTLKDEGLIVGLVTATTNMTDPDAAATKTLFEACGNNGIPAIKIGYFPYRPRFDDALAEARKKLTGFAKLAAQHNVKALYHTHSGYYLGNNAATLRMLLQDVDPHTIGAYLDTGHLALNGGPMRMETDLLKPWFSALAIKDFVWEKAAKGWDAKVVPAGEGIVRWDEVVLGVRDAGFNGTVSVHGEYDAQGMPERKKLAKLELDLLKKQFGGTA